MASRRQARDTDQRFHSAVAELEALMQATLVEQHSTGGSRLLAELVDVPLVNHSAPTPSRSLRNRPTPGPADPLTDILASQKLNATVTRAAMLSGARVGTPPTQRSVYSVAPLGPRCHSASSQSPSTVSGADASSLPHGSPLTSPASHSTMDSQRANRHSRDSPRSEQRAVSNETDRSWVQHTASSSPGPSSSDASEPSRPVSSSHTMPPKGPVSSEAATELRTAAARHREALTEALAVSEARREERRRLRALAANQQSVGAAPPTEEESTVAVPPSPPTLTAAVEPTKHEEAEDRPAHGSGAEAPNADTFYRQEVEAIKANAVANREAKLAELRAERLRDELAEQVRKRMLVIVKDLSWEETTARVVLQEDEAIDRRKLVADFAIMTPQLDQLHQDCRVERSYIHVEQQAAFDYLQRFELFSRWVEVTAGTRVDWELEYELIQEDYIVETAWAIASEMDAEARARVTEQADAERLKLGAAFTDATGEIVQRELWLLVNQEADRRFLLEADERDAHFAVREGCSSSRVLVQQRIAQIRECQRQWTEYFAASKKELLELELAGRLLLQRDAIDGFDRLASDASFERTAMQVADLRRRKEAVDAAIKEAQSYAQHAKPSAATTAAAVVPSSTSTVSSAKPGGKGAPPPRTAKAAAPKRSA